MRVGIDDTDSPRGGCTTWVLTELVRIAREQGLDPIGEPSLVRLNPNVPWKTRGNAALAVRVGHGLGGPRPVGEVDGAPVLAFRRGSEPSLLEGERFVEEAWRAVLRSSPREPGTDPALVAVRRPLPARLYWEAVRDLVRVRDVERVLDRAGAAVRVRSGRRGLVGAAAALAWPSRRATWELIAYRTPDRVGTSRSVDVRSVLAAQRSVPELFLCHDPTTRRLLVTPHTPCPILFGLRGTSPTAPLQALPYVRSEPVDRWMLFRTNQATGDHLVRRRASELTRYRSGILEGTVAGPVEGLPGGHVRFDLRERHGGTVPCLAFEPTKTLPGVARGLLPGDRLRVWGSLGDSGGLRLEGLELVGLAGAGRWRAPACPQCGGREHSLGTGRGWRCDRCRVRLPPEAARWERVRRSVRAGTYHPTPSARRHLAPLAI
jgi:tRNA(Ile2)-agmatinylcytidine synthase